jgi:hypothetical protein
MRWPLLSILPAKRQVLHAASGRTFTQASKNSFDNPWSPETAAAVAAFERCLDSNPESCRGKQKDAIPT